MIRGYCIHGRTFECWWAGLLVCWLAGWLVGWREAQYGKNIHSFTPDGYCCYVLVILSLSLVKTNLISSIFHTRSLQTILYTSFPHVGWSVHKLRKERKPASFQSMSRNHLFIQWSYICVGLKHSLRSCQTSPLTQVLYPGIITNNHSNQQNAEPLGSAVELKSVRSTLVCLALPRVTRVTS